LRLLVVLIVFVVLILVFDVQASSVDSGSVPRNI